MVKSARWLVRAVLALLVISAVVGGIAFAIESIVEGRWGAAAFRTVCVMVLLAAVVKVRDSAH